MLDIKCFEDGNRFIVALEGLDPPSKESIVTNVLKGIVGGRVEESLSSTASPVPEETVRPVNVPEDATEVKEDNKPVSTPNPLSLFFKSDNKKDNQSMYEILLKFSTESDEFYDAIKEPLEAYCVELLKEYKYVPEKLSLKGLNFLVCKQYIAYSDKIKELLEKKYGFKKKHAVEGIKEDKKDILIQMAKTILDNI